MSKENPWHPLALQLLERLLKSADKQEAGVTSRLPSLSGSALAGYRALQSLHEKERFESAMLLGQSEGAIKLQRPRFDPEGFIERIDLVDTGKLAALLGEASHASRVSVAGELLAAQLSAFPTLAEVLSQWARLKRVRGSGPGEAAAWKDACDVILFCRDSVESGALETPVRDASARLFRDSKRIEALIPFVDVLLSGTINAQARTAPDVLQELGLFREEQPARLAGNVVVRRERGSFPLDRPYCGLPPSTVLALGAIPNKVLTIENQTTFQVWARQFCDSETLCIYTAGMPSPAWRAMYVRILSDLPSGHEVLHWGDVDEGGFRIAAMLSRCAATAGHILQPWRMRPGDIPESQRRAATSYVVERMAKYALEAGWQGLANELVEARIVAEQEG